MKTNGKDPSRFEKIGLILTASALLGGMYGSVNDRIGAVETSQTATTIKCDATAATIQDQAKKIDIIYENTIEIKSDVKLLKATKADKKLLD